MNLIVKIAIKWNISNNNNNNIEGGGGKTPEEAGGVRVRERNEHLKVGRPSRSSQNPTH